MEYHLLQSENFNKRSLDGFVRRQEVEQCWRRVLGGWALQPVQYIEDWDLDQRRKIAERILWCVRHGGMAWGAVENGQVVGFALLSGERCGSVKQYMILEELQVSEQFRRQGIGKKLFRLICQGARKMGAAKVYISAHSAKESMDAYRKYGCVLAREVNPLLAEKEPFDVPLEFRL